MYLFIDVETTGKPKDYKASMRDLNNWPRVTQFAFAVYSPSGELQTSAQSLVKPDGWEIPKTEFFLNNNMSTERCEEHGVPMAHLLEPFTFLAKHCEYIVAHNIDFDYNVLGAEMIRYNMKVGKRLTPLCTMRSSTDYCELPGVHGFKFPKLEELHHILFDEGFLDAHDALADVTAAAKCFFELLRLNVIKLNP